MKFITLLILATLFSNKSNSTELCQKLDLTPNQSLKAIVSKIVDGDTINVTIKNKNYSIRMLGIDTPELHFQGKAQPIWGQKAKDVISEIVTVNDRVVLRTEKLVCDKYGRILAHVFKGQLNINLQMIKEGMAANYCIAPNVDYCIEYSKAMEPVFYGKEGVFSDPSFVIPYVWRKQQQGLPMDKPVMDYRTQKVYKPKDYYRIPLPYRVFYMPSKN